MDTGWAPEAFKVCRVERRQRYSGRSTGKVKNQSKRPTVFPVQPGAIRSARWSPPVRRRGPGSHARAESDGLFESEMYRNYEQLEAENIGKHFGTSRKSFTPVLKPEPKAESGSE